MFWTLRIITVINVSFRNIITWRKKIKADMKKKEQDEEEKYVCFE